MDMPIANGRAFTLKEARVHTENPFVLFLRKTEYAATAIEFWVAQIGMTALESCENGRRLSLEKGRRRVRRPLAIPGRVTC